MDLSLITSLYRSAAHLDAYAGRVMDVAAGVAAAGLHLEMVLIANDPGEDERSRIQGLAQRLEDAGTASITWQAVPRETVYASWNRGIALSTGNALGIWNVDDARTGSALVAGARMIADGCDLVDFPFEIVQSFRRWGLFPVQRTRQNPAQYRPDALTRKTRTSPFFLFSRVLFERAGPFDPGFRITGDYEWCARPVVRAARTCTGEPLGGTFYLHGGNLSGTHSQLEVVEDNVVALRHGLWDEMCPADPRLMRHHWETWGQGDTVLPAEWADRLWGPGSLARWRAWQRRQRRIQVEEMLRAGPRWLIDRVGLRAALARWGVVKSAGPET